MKVRVHYRDGKAVDFVVPEDILVVDFAELAKAHGQIRRIEFP
jgi:hypothetical protein